MVYLLLVLRLVFILVVILHAVVMLLSYTSSYCSKLSAFECGFSSYGKVNNTYSLQFFILMLVFILFDLEVVFLIALLVKDMWVRVRVGLVYVFVVGSLYYEWCLCKLVWLV